MLIPGSPGNRTGILSIQLEILEFRSESFEFSSVVFHSFSETIAHNHLIKSVYLLGHLMYHGLYFIESMLI
jgi:hypothetical protein